MWAKPTAPPWHLHRSEPCWVHTNAVYKGCTRGVQGKLKGCSRLRRLYSPRASGVLPLYTTRRADPPPDPEELTRAVPATTTAPHSNRNNGFPQERALGWYQEDSSPP